MFRGINAVNLDAKGRIAMPARYRDDLISEADGRLIVTIDSEERCLLLYPLPIWEEIEKKIEELPSFNQATRRIQRLLIGHATELEMDNNGRLLLPPLLREYASLDGQIMLVGQGKKFELWGRDAWSKERDDWLNVSKKSLNNLPPELQGLSL